MDANQDTDNSTAPPLDIEGYGSDDFQLRDDNFEDGIGYESSGLEYNDADEEAEKEEFMNSLRAALNFKVKPSKNQSKEARIRAFKRSAMAENPEVKDHNSKANEAFAMGKFDDAIKHYNEVLRLDPENVGAFRMLGEIADQRGKRDDCLRYWQLAAETARSDKNLWAQVADLSVKLGHISNGIFAYSKAIHYCDDDKKDDVIDKYDYIYHRAQLHRDRGQYGRARDGFRRLNEKFPGDPDFLKELAITYVEDHMEIEAIRLYLKVFDQNVNAKPEDPKHDIPVFDWTCLNILTDLYIQKRAWSMALKVIKAAARFFQNRSNEKFWDDVNNDAEFDERRPEYLRKANASPEAYEIDTQDIPIDIRYKLGKLRLELGEKEEAMRHFNKLMDFETEEDILDLFIDAGKTLESHGCHQEALEFLSRIGLFSNSFDIETVILLASCYFEVGDYKEAVQTYRVVLDATPDDVNVKLSLVEALFMLGEEEESWKLLREASASSTRFRPSLASALDDATEMVEEQEDEKVDGIIVQNRPVKRGQKLTEEQRIEAEESAKKKVLDTFRRMTRLKKDILQGHKIAVNTWQQLASRLIEIFASVPNFFPRDKSRTFRGIVLYRSNKPITLDERIARAYNLYDGLNDEDTSRQVLTSEKEFRGLDYDDWFMIFVQYALFEATYKGDIEYASLIIGVAQEVIVFVQDKYKEAMLKMVKLILGVLDHDYNSAVTSNIRYFLTSNQFSPFIFKLFLCCFPSGTEAWEAFGNYNHQKFFLRQLKGYDATFSHKKITGMATITADVKNVSFKEESPALLYIYSNLLGGNRNYISPIVYLNRAYKHYYKDPMICLTLGLAHVHRSMQRLSSNRHMQLLQGFSYFLEYRELRLLNGSKYEEQEVEYNFGRLYHMIGLVNEAVDHYNKALSFNDLDPEDDLLIDAAYNLLLIYNVNGNTNLAREITEKYLTI